MADHALKLKRTDEDTQVAGARHLTARRAEDGMLFRVFLTPEGSSPARRPRYGAG